MVNIQTRSISGDLASLVKQLDGMVDSASDRAKPNKAFVVLLTDDPDEGAAKLEQVADKHGIVNTPLTVYDGIAGPGGYNIAKDAEVTVMIWKGGKVQANHSFAKGELNKKAVKDILASAKTVLQ